ncbi:MAG: DUF1684 domain-containing protein [Rhodocyclales bacterium]|nr:DUF1684 domain-containing protein [Rhodocyclales bacterium]
MAEDGIAGWQAWRQARVASLAAPDSWLGLTGLYWLEPGDNAVGTAADAAVPLPAGPVRLGVLRWADGELNWRPAAGEPQPLRTDAGGAPTVVTAGATTFFVIERDGRLAVRVRDLDWAAKQPQAFSGIETFPYDPAWCIEAEWRPLAQPQTMEVPNVSGELKPVRVEWQAVFRVGDSEVALLPMSVSDSRAFFVFRDATSGRQTYGAGRFLNAAAPAGGRIVLDFNRAYNPPCAFTAFATCPLPPPENRLPFAVPAGELRYRPQQ